MTNDECSYSDEHHSSIAHFDAIMAHASILGCPCMRKIPNFVLLRAFEAAGRLESFTLAAHELHLTPSTISHQVRELEEVFGRALFLRAHRRVELTAQGRRLLEGLTRVLDAMEACCAEVNLAASGQVLSVYCAPSLAVKWLGPRLPMF